MPTQPFTFIKGKNVKIYKDGVYLTTLTEASLDATQNTVDKTFIGDDTQVTISTTKTFSGKFGRQAIDEHILHQLLGKIVTNKFSVAKYQTPPTTVRGTVSNGTPVDISFTSPNNAGLLLNGLSFNAIRNGTFTGGLTVEVWQGAAVSGTLKYSFSFTELEIPSIQAFVEKAVDPESSEVAITQNVAHTLRFKATATPSGTIDLYGITVSPPETVPYYALTYEMNNTEAADYVIDFAIVDDANTLLYTFRDTGVVFLNDGLSISPSEPIGEATEWRASSRTLL